MVRRLALGLLALLASLNAGNAGASAAELLMFDDPACVWCRRWTAEIGPGYPTSSILCWMSCCAASPLRQRCLEPH
jgi:hypothetical protein